MLREAKFFLGVGDGACANVGSKCTTAERIAVTIGTSAAARLCLYQPISETPSERSAVSFRIPYHQGLFCYRIDKDHVLLGGALTDGGSVIQWARELLNYTDEEDFENVMKHLETKAVAELKDRTEHHLSDFERSYSNSVPCTVPFLSGERSTGFRNGATGVMMGLTRRTTAAGFLQGCFEGVSFRLNAVLELIAANNTQDEKQFIIASGKAMEVNHYWRQMIADTSGLRVVFDCETEKGSSRGAARLVAMALNECSK
ncbi:MAG: hypothetical protein SGARI_003251 [Bacillariaceae sp.]